MIPKQKIDEVFDAARIEEVVGEFVTLKKKGADYKACCPFHNEKTPSFSVSTSKNIFKCFGCGEGGNVVDFLMKHEQLSFVEAIKYLANKYGIEIEETELTDEEKQKASEKESLFIVTSYAQDYFQQQLLETDEGRSVGLGYFQKRGFTEEIIKKFNLGYCPDKWDDLTSKALSKGYKLSYLTTTGLTKERNGTHYDGFRGRVMFPIHNVSGKCLGFGGRILSEVKKQAKYINSPESPIYDKSNVLYGIFQSKKAISKNDNCFLVEGYTDVISLYQNGIENVVASSGTSLTTGQIKLIKRYTPNITILYDGDIAGAKASFRGIDMVLEQGMNVKVVQFPEGEDPDSMARSLDPEDLMKYISENAQDFIRFKTNVLKQEIQDDPVKKSKLIHDIISSIALIPDQVTRSLFVKESSALLEISEKILLNELNKVRKNKSFEQTKVLREEYDRIQDVGSEYVPLDQGQGEKEKISSEIFERDLIRLILNYGEETILFEEDEDPLTVRNFIYQELQQDGLELENQQYKKIWNQLFNEGERFRVEDFYKHEDESVRLTVIELTASPYNLSDWERMSIPVNTEKMLIKRAVNEGVYAFKCMKIETMIEEEELKLKEEYEETRQFEVIQNLMALKELRKQLKISIGRPI